MPGFRIASYWKELILIPTLSMYGLGCSDAGIDPGTSVDENSFGAGTLSKKSKNKGKKETKRQDPPEATGTDPDTDTGEAEADSGDAGDDGEDFTPPPGEGSSADDVLRKLLADCGATEVIKAPPEEVIYQKNATSEPVKKSQGPVTVTAATDLAITAKPGVTQQNMTVKIVNIEGPFQNIARRKAEEQAAAKSGRLTIKNLPFNEIPTIADKNPEWERINCTIIPAQEIEARRGSYTTTAAFDPPSPTTLSPRAVAERYLEELGDRREFTGIKATIMSSDNPALQGKTTLTGSVSITKVPATYTAGRRTITGDVAYKVVTDFGGVEATFALGFMPEVTYYISFTKGDFAGNVGQTKIADDPTVIFIY